MASPPATLGQLDRDRHAPVSVRDEVRRNLLARLRADEELFPGIVGYSESVEPQVVNALLARHDLILLGLRGQAKTRIARMLVALLDEWRPAIAGTPLREHPLEPVTPLGRAIVAEKGDQTPVEWIHRDERYGEKLATPDVTVADLIGDVDPLKAAHRGLDLSDEEVIHFGIVPRTNHGVFCINEIPDLAPRIQVALLNILEERDVQIRGFPLRIPLDVLMVFTANPEDYTNRGAIITPLKDRIASQILTHYPRSVADARAITEDQAWGARDGGLPAVRIPAVVAEAIEQIAFEGRESEYIDQKSGVSARLPIAARELLISQVERRLVRHASDPPVPRLVDCFQLVPSITGKVELVYEGEQEGAVQVAEHLIGAACRRVFDERFPRAIHEGEDYENHTDAYQEVLAWFAAGDTLDLDDRDDFATHRGKLAAIPRLEKLAADATDGDDPAELALAMELIVEGLHQHNLLSKRNLDTGVVYGDMLRHMMEEAGR